MAAVLVKVLGDLLVASLAGLTTLFRILGPQGIILIVAGVALLVGLAVVGARRFLSQGEQS